ncbi:AGCS family alanine or glycine:cation symporter [Rhodothalassium salexigens DSM 2132]|uniref:AGCS family alanine or glycine:cation symporter n=1 Tax=Rhodothalassium salexigens DSM 2132 TaxID=1188247 RepID=A0A4R2PH61_RHOSA|nr:alanine/glycine:cation symporter family protein [Rhodothalassium salexigens]MBB4211824.1 AGCS family alanine or glycine:cation symporter [Rhodothalassium salexigens DSM 2132]MBK1638159.1 alanine glycine permease [Rhodothalassium salexigens DSM 2132]TCP33878.1 AGCS family alanine or glycine:cation symporter [Rhodothalassium salexigens DSM 2132]
MAGARIATALTASAAAWGLTAFPAAAQDGVGGAVGRAIDAFNGAVFYQVPFLGSQIEWIIIWMFLPMLFLTVWFGFINVRAFPLALNILRGRYRDDTAPGEVTQFQALSTALSGTVGLGNIAGVAIAIGLGGPGAAFWMIVIGFLAMSLKFAECTLGVKYRKENPDGTVSGGPMYYLTRGLAARGWVRAGAILGWLYALLALPSLLQIAQVNQAYSQISLVTGIEGRASQWLFGIVAGVLVGIVILGGIRTIARVTVRLVPLMAAIYVAAALFIIGANVSAVPDAVGLILREALAPEAGIGGVIGALVWGMRRAVYSTEAGLGSATIAHAAARTREPVSEGLVALLEPFIDTVVICTMTALVIIITGAYQMQGPDGQMLNDIQMTSAAFNSVIGGFDVVLAVAVLLFAFSTIISWGYYSGKVWGFIFGESRRSMAIYKLVYCVALMPGAVLSVGQVLSIMDSIFFLMAIPNVIAVYLFAGELKRDLKDYRARIRSGAIRRAEQPLPSAAE